MEHQTTQIERLRQMGRNIGVFWIGISLLMLVALTAYTFAQHPRLIEDWHGWLMLLLAAAYGSWFVVGQQWLSGGHPDSYHRRLMRRELPGLPPRTLVYCAVLLALALGLSVLNENFRFLLYTVYGVVIALFALPWALIPLGPVILVIFAEFGWLPTALAADQWIALLINILTFSIYTAIVYLPFIVLSGRFERERMFAELEQSHRELAEAHRRLEQAAGRDRELAVLRERERLAREMHDTLGHSLVLANVKLEAALRLRTVDPARADHEIAATQDILRTTMGELRASLAGLRGSDGCDKPLAEALTLRAREAAARAGWEVSRSFAPDADDVSDAVREALLRVGMEAIANAERHAHARTVALSLRRDGGSIMLHVADDGRGIGEALAVSSSRAELATVGGRPSSEPTKTLDSPPGHYGIIGMRERVAALGGTLTIRPGEDGHGTVVEARVPIGA